MRLDELDVGDLDFGEFLLDVVHLQAINGFEPRLFGEILFELGIVVLVAVAGVDGVAGERQFGFGQRGHLGAGEDASRGIDKTDVVVRICRACRFG